MNNETKITELIVKTKNKRRNVKITYVRYNS